MEAMAVRMCSLWLFLISGSTVTSLPSQWSAGALINSSVACVRGSQQSPLDLDCRNAQPPGMVGRMYISRIFYGTTPLYKGCNRTAPYSSCCLAEPDVDCVFESDVDMEDIVRRFSGVSQATFGGIRRYSSLGNCDPKIYPDLTSYSIVEFGCASVSLLKDITADLTFQYPEVIFLDSNGYFNNSDVKDSEFHCVARTECNSSLSVTGLFLRRGVSNDSHCAEEFAFQDGKYPEVQSNVTCAAGNLIFNQVLFTSTSNVAMINMSVTGRHTGKVFIKITSSDETSDVIITCGTEFKKVVDNLQPCPQDPLVVYNTTPTSTQRVPLSTNVTQDAFVENSTTLNSTNLVPIFLNDTKNDNHVTLIMGLVIGVLLILLIILVGFILVRRYRKPLNKGESATALSEPYKTVTASSTSAENTYDGLPVDSGFDSRPPSYAEDIQDSLASSILTGLQQEVDNLSQDLLEASCVMTAALVLFPVVIVAVYRLTSRIQDFAQTLQERTRDLEMERKRSEDLLFELLPVSVAKKLLNHEDVPPVVYPAVTVFFSDIVGFTSICSKSTPMQVIDMLNSLYRVFDDIIDRHGLYKVETIGDAYMVVSGLPQQNLEGHAAEMASMALDVRESISQMTVQHLRGQSLQMRIGLNSGPVVAGIVGQKMPRYCLFGDTVNVASKMESTSLQTTRLELVKRGGFIIRERGTVEIQGKGDMTTYWLGQKIPDAADGSASW